MHIGWIIGPIKNPYSFQWVHAFIPCLPEKALMCVYLPLVDAEILTAFYIRAGFVPIFLATNSPHILICVATILHTRTSSIGEALCV